MDIQIAIILLHIFLSNLQLTNAQAECNQDLLDRSFVTQCGPGICEPVLEGNQDGKRASEWPSTKDEVVHIFSTRKGDRFKVNTYKALDSTHVYYQESNINVTIFIETEIKYQRILGFGSTLTDASCTNIDNLPEDVRQHLVSDYFSVETGIGMNLLKIPIGSTKYSFSNYVLDQPDSHQVELSPYDTDHRIPLIRDALTAAGKFKNRVKILASSGTAPPEYKDNNKIIHGGLLRRDKVQDYASYLTGFVAAYKSHEINIWSLVVSESPVSIAQKEDVNDTTDYSSMAMRPSDAITLVRSISKSRSQQLNSDKFRLLLLGDSRAYIPVWADAVFRHSDVADDVAGVAYSCSKDEVVPYDNLDYVTRRYPSKYLLMTQSSINRPMKLGNWQYAEDYGTEIVKNLEYGSVGWIDFNLALDLEGGPTISDKFKGEHKLCDFLARIRCSKDSLTNLASLADASVVIDTRRGFFYRNPMFYAIGHLSRYVKPGSIRVKTNFKPSPHMFASHCIAFVTPDNYLVVFVMNNNIGPMPVTIGVDTRTRVELRLETKSFNTFIIRL